MNPLLRASVVAALALASLEGHAAVRRPCVTTLEAQGGAASAIITTAPPKRPCLVAIAHAPLQRSTGVRRDTREHGRPAVVATAAAGARA